MPSLFPSREIQLQSTKNPVSPRRIKTNLGRRYGYEALIASEKNNNIGRKPKVNENQGPLQHLGEQVEPAT